MPSLLLGSKSSSSWSPLVKYTIASAINLAILTIGIAIGVFISPHFTKTASAAQSASPPPASTQAPKPPDNPNVDYVSPGVTLGGPVATNILLANRIACDSLQVNGFETLKLYDAILNLLARKGIATPADIEQVVAAGKAEKPLRLR